MSDEQATGEQPVLTERRGSVLLITLNRPEVRNAVNAALAEGLGGALDELDRDELVVRQPKHGQAAERCPLDGPDDHVAEAGVKHQRPLKVTDPQAHVQGAHGRQA